MKAIGGHLTRHRLVRFWLPVGLLLLAAIVSIRLVDPRIPDEIYLLTGPKGSAYFQDGQRYRAYLADRGVTAHIVETGGTVENLARLLSDTASAPVVGFAEAGTELLLPDSALAVEHLESLGGLYARVDSVGEGSSRVELRPPAEGNVS